MDFQNLANQYAQTANVQTPTTAFPELSSYFQSRFQALPRQAIMGAVGGLADQKAAEEKQAAAQAHQAAVAAAEANARKLADLADPDKFRRVQKDDGGYDFFDPAGKPITAFDFAKVKGVDPAKVLEGSQNSVDRQFMEDWTNMQNLGEAVAKGDKGFIDQVYKEHPEIGSLKYEDLLKRFKASYPNIFGHQQNENGNASGQRVLPSSQYLDETYKGYSGANTQNTMNSLNSGMNPQQPQKKKSWLDMIAGFLGGS